MTQLQIARRTGLGVSSVNKILNQRVGPKFRKDTVARVLRTAREFGFDFGRLKYLHRRRDDRRPVDLPAEITVYRADGTLLEEGMGVLRDVSRGGARLSDIRLPSGTLPLLPFELGLCWRKGAKEERARGRVVRLDLETGGLALEFLGPSRENAKAPAPTPAGK